jgi:hypothetical protein
MPTYRPTIFLPTPIEKEHVDQMRDVVKEARKVLEQPVPDTFLSRKTHEPFPPSKSEKE